MVVGAGVGGWVGVGGWADHTQYMYAIQQLQEGWGGEWEEGGGGRSTNTTHKGIYGSGHIAALHTAKPLIRVVIRHIFT